MHCDSHMMPCCASMLGKCWPATSPSASFVQGAVLRAMYPKRLWGNRLQKGHLHAQTLCNMKQLSNDSMNSSPSAVQPCHSCLPCACTQLWGVYRQGITLHRLCAPSDVLWCLSCLCVASLHNFSDAQLNIRCASCEPSYFDAGHVQRRCFQQD